MVTVFRPFLHDCCPHCASRFSADLTSKTTHLVVDASNGEVLQTAKLQAAQINPALRDVEVVDVGWLLACKQHGCRVPEADFRVLVS